MNIIVVIDFPEAPGDLLPVVGRNGMDIGLAFRCPKRGTMCLRLPLEEFRKVRHELFEVKRNGQFPVPDIEIEGMEGDDANLAENLKIALAEVETLKATVVEKEALLKEADGLLASLTPNAELSTLNAERSSEEGAPAPAPETPVISEPVEEITDTPESVPPVDPTSDLPPPTSSMTPSEAGTILGNGIPEPEDAEAARLLAAQSQKANEESPANDENVESGKQPEPPAQEKPAPSPAKAPARKPRTKKGQPKAGK